MADAVVPPEKAPLAEDDSYGRVHIRSGSLGSRNYLGFEIAEAEQVLRELPEAIKRAKEWHVRRAREEYERARSKLKALGEDC
jgi:hypothetical protein